MTLLRANQEAMFALNAYRAECVSELTYSDAAHHKKFEAAWLTAEKPTKMRYDSWTGHGLKKWTSSEPPKTDADFTFASDGKELAMQFGKVYRTEDGSDPNRLNTILEPWGGFYTNGTSLLGEIEATKSAGGTAEVSRQGTEDVDGTRCDKILIHLVSDYQGQKIDETRMCYIGQRDKLVRRAVSKLSFDGKPGYMRDAIIKNIDTHPAVDPNIYVYKPPAGVTAEADRKEVPRLADGKAAPPFQGLDADHKSIQLSSFKGKIVVLDFWASWCGPCMQSMPHTQEVVKKLQSEGIPVVGLAVDSGEPAQAFFDWTSAQRQKYPNLQFVSSDPSLDVSGKLYGVSGIPTVFIIDKSGHVVTSLEGYGGPTDELETAIRKANGVH